MSSPLLAYWQRLLRAEGAAQRKGRPRVPTSPALRESTVFLVLRRMRAPLLGLIVIYAISVLGLTLVPGVDDAGRPWRMSFFHAFYFMSYTATTIGFGEIPHAFSNAQRMWVTFSIYLTVIGWAWAIGTLLALLQDYGFRRALALRRFASRVRGLHEPFVLVAGYGQAGRRLVRSLDLLGRRSVVVDVEQEHIDELAMTPLALDVPGLAADVRVPGHLALAGLAHHSCAAVIALSDDDETNLAVTMAVALLRPDVRVYVQAFNAPTRERMVMFGQPRIIDPFDRFGDYLRAAIRSPASFRLIEWLSGGPGSLLPRLRAVPRGRWIVCGFGRFGRHVAADLRAEGMEVTVIEPGVAAAEDSAIIVGDATDGASLAKARPETAVGFIAATNNDTANVSMIVAARRANPKLFLIARENDPSNHALFRKIDLDFALVPAEVVAREVLADMTSPLLYRFLESLPGCDDAWSTEVTRRLVHTGGERMPAIWRVTLDRVQAPAVLAWLAEGRSLSVGALLGSRGKGQGRVVLLMRLRGGEQMLAPGNFVDLAAGDELLLAAHGEARRALMAILASEAARDRALLGIDRPAGWVWQRLARRRAGG